MKSDECVCQTKYDYIFLLFYILYYISIYPHIPAAQFLQAWAVDISLSRHMCKNARKEGNPKQKNKNPLPQSTNSQLRALDTVL